MIEMFRWSVAMSDMYFAEPSGIKYALGSFSDVFASCNVTQAPNVVKAFMMCRTQPSVTSALWVVMSSNVTLFNQRLRNFVQGQQNRQKKRTVHRTSHSDGVSAVDTSGNACAISHSINTATMWGTGLFVDGVPLTDTAFGGLNQAYIFDNPQDMYPEYHLPTPTREVVGVTYGADSADKTKHRAGAGGSRTFSIATIGDSLAQVTLQLLASFLAGASPANTTVNQGLFLHSEQKSIGCSMNLCDVCNSTNSYFCVAQNQQTNCVTDSFLSQLPIWLQGEIEVKTGLQRWMHSGPMVVTQRTELPNGEMMFEAASTPGGNGNGFVG